MPQHLLLLGHRGSPRRFTENTLAGFQDALDAGLGGIELDVRQLADGTLAIHHDPHLKDGRVLAGLSRADLPPQVPTLTDVLDWMAGNDAYVNIEIKAEPDAGGRRVARTLEAVQQRGLGKRVIVSSFSPQVLVQAQECAPEIERAFLVHRTYRCGEHDLSERVMERTGCAALHPHFSLVDAALMAQARAQGWRVNVWTVNDPAQAARLRDLGVNALIGDLPQVLLEAGVRIYLYPAPMVLHAKCFTVDDEVAVVGSSNMDMRSFSLNMEISVMLLGAQMVDQVNQVQAHYRSISKELTLEEWEKRPRLQRWVDNAARLTATLQ